MAAFASTRPAWPFGKTAAIPHRENPPRTACVPCAGGGDINGLPCRDCQGLGYHDEHNPPITGK